VAIFIVRDLFKETAGAEVQLAFGALPTYPTDFSDGALVTSARHVLPSSYCPQSVDIEMLIVRALSFEITM